MLDQLVWLAGVLLILIGAPLLSGIINRVKAFYAGRQGPRWCQLYFDLAKLIRKERLYSRSTGLTFRAAPVVNLAVTLAALLLLPLGGAASCLAFPGDFVLLVYLCGTGRLFTMLAALDTGSSFEGMGASREGEFSILAEGAFFTVLAALVLLHRDLTLSGLLGGTSTAEWSGNVAALCLLGAAFLVVILTECCRVPVDDPETHLELTMIHEAMILDNEGPDLALIHYAAALKMALLLLVEAMLLLPRLGCAWCDLILELAAVAAGAVVIGVAESVMARSRFKKLPVLQAGAWGFALLAVVLLTFFGKGR